VAEALMMSDYVEVEIISKNIIMSTWALPFFFLFDTYGSGVGKGQKKSMAMMRCLE
jgi:hypothetical protein